MGARALIGRVLARTSAKGRRELEGARVVFDYLRPELPRGGRILEVGPKHGLDTRLLATLEPRELVTVDLPEKADEIASWLPEVPVARHVEANVLHLSEHERAELGRFDLVWCLGVLYHNVEQLRLLRRLYELTAESGLVVVESATTRNRILAGRNVVELHWPETYRSVPTITHLPSRRAIASWLEMVGFADVRVRKVYSRSLGWQRAVVTGRRDSGRAAYAGYGLYAAGTAD
jgi:2-polyprenyl-3-methyl-5-hydroxy-6-metoxy-1,4-benzoquinol methylase